MNKKTLTEIADGVSYIVLLGFFVWLFFFGIDEWKRTDDSRPVQDVSIENVSTTNSSQ